MKTCYWCKAEVSSDKDKAYTLNHNHTFLNNGMYTHHKFSSYYVECPKMKDCHILKMEIYKIKIGSGEANMKIRRDNLINELKEQTFPYSMILVPFVANLTGFDHYNQIGNYVFELRCRKEDYNWYSDKYELKPSQHSSQNL